MNCHKELCNTSVPSTKLLPKLLPILISDYAPTKNKSYVLTTHLSSANFSCGFASAENLCFEDVLGNYVRGFASDIEINVLHCF